MDPVLYEEHAALEADHWWFVARRSIIAAVLDRYLSTEPAVTRILDAGCGTGGMLPMLARFGTVRGLEADPGAVARSHATYPDHEVRQGEVPAGASGLGSFEVVTAFDVIEHIADDRDALRGLAQVLAPTGTMVLTVPALPWLWSEHDVMNGHHRRYTEASLRGALDDAGLECLHSSYFNTVLFPMVAAARLVQRVRPKRPDTELSSDFTMPSPWLNRILLRAMSAERRVVAGHHLPLGVSLIAVARPAHRSS